jgi:hypothetical protein
MFFVTFVLCFSLGIYLSNIMKITKEDQDEGLKLPWYYPLSPSYWMGLRKNKKRVNEIKVHPVAFLEEEEKSQEYFGP